MRRARAAARLLLAGAALLAPPADARAQEPAKAAQPAPAEAERPPARSGARSPSASKAPTWFAAALAHSELGLNVAYFWSKGPWLRAETVIGGRKVVSLVVGDTYYAYDATSLDGVAIGRSRAAIAKDAPDRRPFGRDLEVIERQGGEKVGEEEVGGRVCERYRVTDAAGRREVWVTKDELQLPVKLEIYARPTGKTIHTDYVNWSAALALDDGFFQPEPGVRFQRLSYEEYAARQFTPIGPVPILYMDLLSGE
jgi:hypothetical protein